MPPIIVALDGSEFADAALPVALGLARTTGDPLELVAVVEPAPGPRAVSGARVPDLSLDQEQETLVREALQAHLEQLRVRMAAVADAPAVTITLLRGQPAAALLEHAERVQARLVVITTHGRGGLSRLWLGSVTEALTRQSTRPVVVVRPTDAVATTRANTPADAPANALANLTPTPFQRVLVTFDGTRASEQVLTPLLGLFGTRVAYLLMRAVSPLHPMLRRIATGAEYARDLAVQTDLVARYLNRIVDDVRAAGADAAYCSPQAFEPARAINEAAADAGADLIAIATSARGPVGRVLLGSVADKVVRTADRPVLLYRQAGEIGA
jgi:nucleotide-binding universal stress UspA family protein